MNAHNKELSMQKSEVFELRQIKTNELSNLSMKILQGEILRYLTHSLMHHELGGYFLYPSKESYLRW